MQAFDFFIFVRSATFLNCSKAISWGNINFASGLSLMFTGYGLTYVTSVEDHDDVIKSKHFPRCWPFVRGTTGRRSQTPMERSFHIFFDLRLNKRLSKQSRRRWFETPSWSLWRHCNGDVCPMYLRSNKWTKIRRVVMMPSLEAPQVVIMTTFDTASIAKVGIGKTLGPN